MVGSRVHRLYHRYSPRKGGLPRGSAGRHPMAARGGPRAPARAPTAHALHELIALSRAQFDASDEGEILRLAMDHIVAAGPYSAEAGYLKVGGDLVPSPWNGRNARLGRGPEGAGAGRAGRQRDRTRQTLGPGPGAART